MSGRHTSAGEMQVSEATRRLNPNLFSRPAEQAVRIIVNPETELRNNIAQAERKRLRQSDKPIMNKLETRFYEEQLVPDYVLKGEAVHIQAVRLELARGIWYKPDFFLPAAFSRMPAGGGKGRHRGALAYEVKGPKVFRGGFENLKVAARVHPWITFYLVWEDEKTGRWDRQEILT